MTRVLEVPPTLDERAFDALIADASIGAGDRALVDARHLRWADPYGMIGLLSLGRALGEAGVRPSLQFPQNPDVARYLGRMGFASAAQEVYEVHAAPRGRGPAESSSVLLEITPIRSNDDVHGVVDQVSERAGDILVEKLGYGRAAGAQFSIVLSEVCQNITEHAGSGGWVGIQSYNWQKRLGRNVVVIAVMDLGVGFRGSLAKEHAARFGDRWSDTTALEAAFIHGVTRFRDPGRGQGIKNIRKSVGRWGGKISIRSGTARIADVPEWDDAPPMESGLPFLPGSQIRIVLPGVV